MRSRSSSRRHWTQYWQQDTVRNFVAGTHDRTPAHTAGNLFVRRGVNVGDEIFVVSRREGSLSLIGRMEVEQLVGRGAAEKLLGTDDLWDADDHAIGGMSRWHPRDVAPDVVDGLRFIDAAGHVVPLRFEESGLLDRQTLRGVRELTPESASVLRSLATDG